ncbi:E3 ubiquitin-protein ligase znrf2-like [Daphnia pulicaria]|uniref:E3 ubiquitin-protein ligase znrf2-like n=1 Tax=Daphnia pulicaria TaxID=35523 RepID=UPI001EEB592C|nr:E3 ubiquitin-protein ligase znrf2-like [Daphnia pulicaria]
MGSKSSTPASPVSDDSSPTRQIYSRAERVSDYEQSARQARQERSFMERAESSIQNFIYSTNTSSVDIQRSSHTNGQHTAATHDRLGSSLETPAHQPVRPSSIPTGTSSRSYSIGSSGAGVAVGQQSDSTSSSISSNTGLGHFLSNFNLWRASGPSSSDRQRAQSLSHMPDPALLNQSSTTNQGGDPPSRSHYETEEPSSLSNPRAALTRLLTSRESRSTSSSANNPSSATIAESSSGHHQRRDNSGAFSVRDLTFAAAQEFLAEATLNGLGLGRVYVTHSLPSHMWAVNGIKCPVCSKFVMPDDIECHLVMCLTKPRLNYNEDILTDEKGECVICLEDLLKGHVIARLPCLCVYHKSCIDQWFDVNRSCPEHPSD